MGKFSFQTEEGVNEVEFHHDPASGTLTLGDKTYRCTQDSVILDDKRVPFWTHRTETEVLVWLDGVVHRFAVHDPRRRSSGDTQAGPAGGTVKAQMPGKILRIKVEEGQTVEAGDNLLVMESMKMELALDAPVSGTVEKVTVAAEEMVSQGAVLVEIREDEE